MGGLIRIRETQGEERCAMMEADVEEACLPSTWFPRSHVMLGGAGKVLPWSLQGSLTLSESWFWTLCSRAGHDYLSTVMRPLWIGPGYQEGFSDKKSCCPIWRPQAGTEEGTGGPRHAATDVFRKIKMIPSPKGTQEINTLLPPLLAKFKLFTGFQPFRRRSSMSTAPPLFDHGEVTSHTMGRRWCGGKVAKMCPTLVTHCSPPGSSVHRIL